MRDAVELAPQERMTLVLGKRGEVAEHVTDPPAPLRGHLGLARIGRPERAPLLGVLEDHAVGAHARELVEGAVAHEAVQPRAQLDVALVAAQRAAGAEHRLLHDVLGLVGRLAEDLAGVALERPAVALEDLVERAVLAPAEGGDEALVVGFAAAVKHGTGSRSGPSPPPRCG